MFMKSYNYISKELASKTDLDKNYISSMLLEGAYSSYFGGRKTLAPAISLAYLPTRASYNSVIDVDFSNVIDSWFGQELYAISEVPAIVSTYVFKKSNQNNIDKLLGIINTLTEKAN